MKFLRRSGSLYIILLIVFLAGCSSAPKPQAELVLAKDSIERAKVSKAYDIAPKNINAAETKLAQAEDLMDQEENRKAKILLEQAQKDAETAIAKVNKERAKTSLEELKTSMAELEKKLQSETK